MGAHRNCKEPQRGSSTHGFGDVQKVDGMMRMDHTDVSVHSDGHQEQSAPSAVHRKHEEDNITERFSEIPLEVRDVVSGSKRQNHDEQEVGHGQVEEKHGAALPGFEVEKEDPQSKAVPHSS